MAGVPVFGGLLILSILIIHNPGCIEGILEREEMSPKAAYGFLTLNSTYNKYESPDNETRVGVWMEPTFVIEIDSLAWRLDLEMKLEVTWQDGRVWWRKDKITNPGDKFTFEPSILQ